MRKLLVILLKNVFFASFLPFFPRFTCPLEFGAVLLNMQTGKIEDQFHHYVRPVRYPYLSPYCINLTGITQSMIDGEELFPDVFTKFQQWVQEVQDEKDLRFATRTEKRAVANGPNATFCSWSLHHISKPGLMHVKFTL